MKVRLSTIVIVCFVTFSPLIGICSEMTDFPLVIQKSLESYKKNGADSLIPLLLKGSPLEGDKTALSQSNNIRQIESFYGKYLNFEPIKIIKLSKSTKLVFYVMNYEKGPLFSSATTYQINGSEIIINFNYHTDIKEIMPSGFFGDL